GLRRTRQSVNAAARAARLAAVRGGHLFETTPAPGELEAEHLRETGPPRVGDAPPQVAPDHPLDVQLLQNDDAVALGESCGLDVQEVVALPPHLAVDAGDAILGFLSVLRSFLPSADGSLGASESLQGGFEATWVGDHVAIRGGTEVRDAAVDRDDGCLTRRRRGDPQLADDAGEPLISVALQRARLGLSFERTMQDSAERAQLGEADVRAVEPPRLRVGLAEAERVSSSSLEAGSAGELLEAALPRLVEFDEELRADVAGGVGEPRQVGTQICQLVDLIERGWEDASVARTGVPHEALLEREVPECTESVVPFRKTRNLCSVWIDAEPKRLANKHETDHSLVCDARNRLPNRPTRCLCVDGAFGLRAEVQAQGDHGAGLCGTANVLGSDVQGFRVRAAGDWVRGRSRTLASGVPTEGGAVDARQLAQGGVGEATAIRTSAGSRAQVVGAALLEPELLRGVVWRSTVGDRQTLRGGATRRRRFLPALKGEVSAPEIG